MNATVYREATATDAAEIAALHAESWRRHYRHSYPESFFGDSLDDDRLTAWTERLLDPSGTCTVVARVSEEVVGFIHVVLDGDAAWGALVDNLHVRHDFQRHGIASQLMKRGADFVGAAAPHSGLYLWVLERNVRAQAFYRRVGGTFVDRRPVDPPALPGSFCLRCVWPEPSVLARLGRGDSALS